MLCFLLPVLLLVSAVTALQAPQPITYRVCSDAGATGKITSVSIVPNPVQVGITTWVNATGTLAKPVGQGATWKLSASFNRITVYWKHGSLCEDATLNLPFGTGHIFIHGLTCPQKAGAITIQEGAEFTKKPLSGTYGIHAEMYDENKNQILCLDISVPM